MNPDPALVSDPIVVLLAWAGGVALAAAVVTGRGVVGAGFTWLASATSVLIGVWVAVGGDLAAAAGVIAVGLGGVVVKWSRPAATTLLGLGALGLVAATAELAGWPLALTATAALGGITGEMLLGHWYLVDPTLSRTILRALAVGGAAGMLLDVTGAALLLGLPDNGFLIAVLAVLALTTIGLMGAVVGALRYPAYSGVMAATGLSYLAVLTGLATVFFARVFPNSGTPF